MNSAEWRSLQVGDRIQYNNGGDNIIYIVTEVINGGSQVRVERDLSDLIDATKRERTQDGPKFVYELFDLVQ